MTTSRSALVVTAFVAFAFATSASARDIHLFGRVGSSQGLGIDGGSFGLESRFQLGDFILCGGLVRAEKSGLEASFTTGSVEWRRQAGNRLVYGARVSVVDQRTPEYHKTAFFPSLRFGYAPKEGFVLLATYSAPDNTENEATGFGVAFEALRHRKLGFIVDAERVSYWAPAVGERRAGTRVALLVGARF